MKRTGYKTKLGEENRKIESAGRLTLLKALCDPRVLALSVMYFMSVTANYGIVFFMPQIIKGIGLSNMMTGFVSSVPYIIGTVGLIIWGWSSDRKPERRWHLIVASTLAAVGLVFAGWTGASYWALLGMTAATDRHLRLARLLLADAVDLPHRHGRGRRDRADQCGRQPRRLCRPLHRRLDQGFDRQFPGRSVFSRRLFVRMRRDHVLRRACVRRARGGQAWKRSTARGIKLVG